MRQMICLAVLILCLISMSGCDSEQPQETGGQTMQVHIVAQNAVAGIYDIWEQYFDYNNDGIPDDQHPDGTPILEPIQVACRRATDSSGEMLIGSGQTPWNYSLEISIIRAGTTIVERLTTTDALAATFNLTPYSEAFLTGGQLPGGDCPPFAVCNPIGRVLGTNRIVIDSSYDFDPFDNPAEPVDYDLNLNRWDLACPGSPGLGEARMSGTLAEPLPAPFTMDLEKGDTILVKARKSFIPPEGVELFSEPVIAGAVFLNGLQIGNLTGTSVSTSEQAAGVTFSFTVN